MRSPSIDNFYTQLDKQILLIQSYTEISDLFFIVKACRLKPISYLEEKSKKIVLYRDWVDEFGNSFRVENSKKVRIVYNDLSLKRESITCTDLYYGLSLDKLSKISKLVYVCIGKDEDYYKDCAVVTFLGIDNYLRSYMYLYDEWQQVSPLVLGLKNLKLIGKNRDVKHFLELNIKENTPIPCISGHQWLSFLPPSKGFLDHMEKECEFLAPLFKQRNNETNGR